MIDPAHTHPLAEASIPLKKFLAFGEHCPPRWKHFDLYLFHDEQAAFYAGQSYCAFERVWEHIRGGPKGHSIMGRFILCNWPHSARWTIRLLWSAAPRFACVHHNLDAAERMIIAEYTPCFNISLNQDPAPIPAGYRPPNAAIKHLRSYRRMLREAGYAPRTSPEDTEWE
jgi:hypothetical protein